VQKNDKGIEDSIKVKIKNEVVRFPRAHFSLVCYFILHFNYQKYQIEKKVIGLYQNEGMKLVKHSFTPATKGSARDYKLVP